VAIKAVAAQAAVVAAQVAAAAAVAAILVLAVARVVCNYLSHLQMILSELKSLSPHTGLNDFIKHNNYEKR
jgi:hypothetical protein